MFGPPSTRYRRLTRHWSTAQRRPMTGSVSPIATGSCRPVNGTNTDIPSQTGPCAIVPLTILAKQRRETCGVRAARGQGPSLHSRDRPGRTQSARACSIKSERSVRCRGGGSSRRAMCLLRPRCLLLSPARERADPRPGRTVSPGRRAVQPVSLAERCEALRDTVIHGRDRRPAKAPPRGLPPRRRHAAIPPPRRPAAAPPRG
jgi:hypothetical protein